MKKIVWILFLLGSAVVCMAQPGYPVNLRNVIIGYQTTPEGLFFRGNHSPTHIPLEKYGTFMYVDTLTRQIWMYLDKDTVNGQPVGVWAKMYPSVSDLSSLTDVNTTGKIQNSMLIYDAVTSKWIIDNGTVYRKTTDTLSGQVYGAYNNTKLDSVSALYFDLDTPPVTLGVGMLSWDATTGTASLGLLGGNVQLKVGQQLVKRVVNKTTTNVNLLKSEYKVVKLLGATGSRISVDLAQANSEAGSAGTLGVVIEDINNNQEGFILVAGEITNINTTGNLVGETWNQGDVLYLSATTPGALTKVKPTPPNHTVIVGWVESVNANNGKIYVKIDNGYELEELHNVLTTDKTNGSILYYDNGLWKASTGITLDNTGTLALNAVTANTLMYVDADKKLRSVTLTTTGSSGAATFSNGTLNIPQYAGSTDLTFTGSSSPVTLNSSTGTDVTLTAGTNIAFSQVGNNLTINSTATSSNIYNSNGSIPASTTREVTVPDNSAVKFLETATKFTNIKGGSVLLQSSTGNTLEANTSGLFRSSSTSNGNSSVQLSAGQVGLYGNTGENLVTPGLFVTADNKAGFTTSSTGTSDSVVVKTAITNELKSLTPQETRTLILPSQASNANKYLKTNGTDVSWADVVAGVSNVTASTPLSSSGGATPNITIQQASTSQNGFLSSTDWNTFNNKQAALTFTTPLINTSNTITINQAGTSTNGFLTSTDWNTFNNKQNALTNPVTGTGAVGKVAFWGGTNTISNNYNFHWNDSTGRLGIGTHVPASFLHLRTIAALGSNSWIRFQYNNAAGSNDNAYIGVATASNAVVFNKSAGTLAGNTATTFQFYNCGGLNNDGFWNGVQFWGHSFTENGSNQFPKFTLYSNSTTATDPSIYNFNFELGNTGNTPGAIRFASPTNTGSYINFNDLLYATTSSKVGIGTIPTSTDSTLTVAGGGRFTGGLAAKNINFSSVGAVNMPPTGIYSGANNVINFSTNGSSKLTLNTNGTATFNTVAGAYSINANKSIQARDELLLTGTDNSLPQINIKNEDTGASGGYVNYKKSRGATGAVVNGDELGTFSWGGKVDDAGGIYASAGFRANVSGTVTSNFAPIDFTIFTSPTQVALVPQKTDRLIVKYTGEVGIGTASPQNLLHVAGSFRVDGATTISNAPTAIASNSNQVLLRNTSTGEVSSLVGTVTDQVLKWDNTSSRWYAGTDAGGGGATGLTSLNGLSASSQTFAVGASPGISISSAASTHTFTLANQALAFHNLSTNGIVARTAASTVAARTITGTSPITVTNGDGVSANPTIALSTVPITSGGTGATTQQAALNALAGGVISGQYLRGNGTNVTMSTIQAADIPTLNQNTTGTASNVTGIVAVANGGTGLNSVTGYLKGTGAAYTAVSTIPVADGGTGLGAVNSNGLVLFNNNTTASGTYTRQTPSVYTTSSTGTSLTWDLVHRSSGVYRISHISSTTISSVTVSNVVAGGVYAFHISGASNTVTITVQWPAGTFKDLTASTDYGTRVYTTPTIITCYYDGAQFVCE